MSTPGWPATIATLLVLVLVGIGLFWIADRFAAYEKAQHERRVSRPHVISTRPIDGDARVPVNSPFRAELFLPGVGSGVEPESVTDEAVRLVDIESDQRVPATLTAAADGSSVSLTPAQPLVPGRQYRFEVTDALRDKLGVAFSPYSANVVADASPQQAAAHHDVAYEQVPLAQKLEQSIFTVLAWGPSPEGDPVGRDLFAGTADGRIFRYGLKQNGTLYERNVLFGLHQNNDGPRLVTGLAFDPSEPTTLWVSHGVSAFEGADDFTGKLSTLTGDGFSTYTDRVVGLPRAYKDHLNFAIAFDPRDASVLYVSQGSNTSVGAPDSKWNNRPERLLTAAILRVDLDRLPTDQPLNVATPPEPGSPFAGGDYEPRDPTAAVTVHATGIRSGYDLLWHSSGRLLTAINGAGRGGNVPGVTRLGQLVSGPIMSLPVTTDDVLADITEPGSYHGHPNAARGEHVLMGGNPTAKADPYEIDVYAVGTKPESHWQVPLYNFGKGYSVNGLYESRAPIFNGSLQGHVFATRFSAGDDVILLEFDEQGKVIADHIGVPGLTNLQSPLDIVEDPVTGNLYVSEFDTHRLVLLRPVERSTFAKTGTE